MEEEPDVVIVTKVDYTYEDTRYIIGVEPKYKWGGIYRLITHHEVLDTGFEEETIYANIERSVLMRVATKPELFPCSEVIGWILPRADVTTMILANIYKHGYAAYRHLHIIFKSKNTKIYTVDRAATGKAFVFCYFDLR